MSKLVRRSGAGNYQSRFGTSHTSPVVEVRSFDSSGDTVNVSVGIYATSSAKGDGPDPLDGSIYSIPIATIRSAYNAFVNALLSELVNEESLSDFEAE